MKLNPKMKKIIPNVLFDLIKKAYLLDRQNFLFDLCLPYLILLNIFFAKNNQRF